jgi:hypothetical protein
VSRFLINSGHYGEGHNNRLDDNAGIPTNATSVRRLSILEATAATSVIVACLSGLAIMTGVLPAPSFGKPIKPINQSSLAPRLSPASKSNGSQTLDSIGASSKTNQSSMAAIPSALMATLPIADSQSAQQSSADGMTPTTSGLLLDSTLVTNHPDDLTNLPIPVPTHPSEAKHTVATEAASPPKKHTSKKHTFKKHKRQAHYTSRLANQQSAGKTRAQVRAELMQAKRNGNYPAAIYR